MKKQKDALIIKSLILGIVVIFSVFIPAVRSMDQTATKYVISVDTGTFAPNDNKEAIIKNALRTAPKILARHPILTTVYANTVIQKAIGISKQKYGMSNIIQNLAQQLQDEKYGTLTQSEQEQIIKIAIAPVLKPESFEIIKKWKQKSYPVIGFTNRDNYEFDICQQILKDQYNTDISQILNYVVTIPCWQTSQHFPEHEVKKYHKLTADRFIADKPFPQEPFIHTISHIGTYIDPNATICIVPQKEDHFNHLKQSEAQNMRVYRDLKELNDQLETMMENPKTRTMEDLD